MDGEHSAFSARLTISIQGVLDETQVASNKFRKQAEKVKKFKT